MTSFFCVGFPTIPVIILCMSGGDRSAPGTSPRREFCTTRWPVVLNAKRHPEPEGCDALEEICRQYWQPLYAYLRRMGRSSHDAQDIVQGFFQSIIADRDLHAAQPSRGRFRSFLLGALKHYLSDQRRKETALKRGGGRPSVSLDVIMEGEGGTALPHTLPSDDVFDRQWSITLIERVISRLQLRHRHLAPDEIYSALRLVHPNRIELPSYAELSARTGLSDGGVKTVMHRLRQDFGRLLRAEVARTLHEPTEVEAELRHLVRSWSA